MADLLIKLLFTFGMGEYLHCVYNTNRDIYHDRLSNETMFGILSAATVFPLLMYSLWCVQMNGHIMVCV